jgi:putative SOS response-associated peptidase YedK
MCGRYTVLTEDEIIEIREILQDLSLRIVKDEFLEYDEKAGEICPSDHAPVIIKNEEGISFESVKWGFKKWNGSGVIINARFETITMKSTFSKCIEAGRCVVPAGEFFEWEKLASGIHFAGKKKHFIKDKNDNILFMAGLYHDTEDGREFVIITKKATGEMKNIHDRMPVILRVDQIESWLSGKLFPDDLEKLDFDLLVTPCEDDDGNDQLSLFP